MKATVSIVLGIVAAVVLGLICLLLVGGGDFGGTALAWVALLGWIPLAVLFARASTLRQATGRGFLTIGLANFGLPVAGIIFTLVAGVKLHPRGAPEGEQLAATAGTLLGGGVLTIVLGIFGFFVGLFFVVGAYFLLRKTPS